MEEKVEPSIGELIGRIDAALEAEAKNDELSALRNEVAALKSIEAERNEARREARLTLSQLHQSQKGCSITLSFAVSNLSYWKEVSDCFPLLSIDFIVNGWECVGIL